jgi:hypothetical protein
MKHLLPILLLLWAVLGFGQEPLDSVSFAKMAYSVSAMAIKPIEHPEELPLQALQRLEKDLQQKHSKRYYKVETIQFTNI